MDYRREEALAKIRAHLVAQRRADETSCQTAARLGIFCHGYDRWTTAELRDHYPWLAKRLPPDTPREKWLQAITDWDGARMVVDGADPTCDPRNPERMACLRFERFSGPQLRSLFPQLFAPHDNIG